MSQTPTPSSSSGKEMFIVYTSPGCMACTMTQRELDKHDATYAVVDLSEHPELVESFRQQGYRSAPIVEAEGERFAGFRPDRIKAIMAAAQVPQPRRSPSTTSPEPVPPHLRAGSVQSQQRSQGL